MLITVRHLTLATTAMVVLSLLTAACHVHREPRVAFVVELSNRVPDGDRVYLAGSLNMLGFWRPDGLHLLAEGDRTSEGPGAGALFKITTGIKGLPEHYSRINPII